MDKRTIIVSQLIMTFMMAFSMSAIMALIAVGPEIFFDVWPKQFVIAWPIAFIMTNIIWPISNALTNRIVGKRAGARKQ